MSEHPSRGNFWTAVMIATFVVGNPAGASDPTPESTSLFLGEMPTSVSEDSEINTDRDPAQAPPATSPSPVRTSRPASPAVTRKFSPVPTATQIVAQDPAKPEKPPSPFRFIYGAEYEGPRIGSALETNQPQASEIDSATIDHDFRIAYNINKKHQIGIRQKFGQFLQLSETHPETFQMKNFRFFGSWGGMINTKHLEMDSVLDVFLPTSEGSQKNGLITQFSIKNNWTFKTELRNWSFSALTIVSPFFWNNPVDQTELGLILIPMVSLDIGSGTTLYFEGFFDASRTYQMSFFDFQQDGSDSFTFGPQFTLNKYMNIYPALRFYTGDLSFKTATLYVNFSASF